MNILNNIFRKGFHVFALQYDKRVKETRLNFLLRSTLEKSRLSANSVELLTRREMKCFELIASIIFAFCFCQSSFLFFSNRITLSVFAKLVFLLIHFSYSLSTCTSLCISNENNSKREQIYTKQNKQANTKSNENCFVFILLYGPKFLQNALQFLHA